MTTRKLVALLNLTLLSNKYANQLVYARSQFVAICARRTNHVNYATACTMRNLQGSITNLTCFLTKDCTKQTLFSSKFCFTLRGNFAYQNIAREYFSTHANNAIGIQVRNHILRDIGDFTRDFLRTKLGVTCVNFVFSNMNRSQQVFCNYTLRNDDSVLVVVAFPWHVSNHEVLTKGQLRLVARRTVCQNIALKYRIALANQWLVVHAARLVGTLELRNQVFVVFAIFAFNDDGLTVYVVNHAGVLSNQNFARVNRNTMLDARTNQWCIRTKQRYCLTLHVRTHQSTVCVVVLEERNKRRCNRGHLAR